MEDNEICHVHAFFSRKVCITCGRKVHRGTTTIPFDYMFKHLRITSSAVERLRKATTMKLLSEKKLILILDLDNTLIHSKRICALSKEEEYLLSMAYQLEDNPNRSIAKFDALGGYLIKLRPFVRKFLRKASRMFDMYVYTNGCRAYAYEIAKLLDPEGTYFKSKVISREDCTTPKRKGLDVVLGEESMVVILDDTKDVWQCHTANLIRMKGYTFFASGCCGQQSLSELQMDESESDGELAMTLKILKELHKRFFDPGLDAASRDTRKLLSKISKSKLRESRRKPKVQLFSLSMYNQLHFSEVRHNVLLLLSLFYYGLYADRMYTSQ